MAWDRGWPKGERDPTMDELRSMAKHSVGDEVCIYGHTKWRVKARYWSRSRRCIMYRLVFEYNGATTEVAEGDLWQTVG